ncbi:MAG: alpha/beta hydrolase [Actinomycetota bacterium]|nr:alpha/beta hydrolase [Actinomycetota bacterium]
MSVHERIDVEVSVGLDDFFARTGGPGGFNAIADLDERRLAYNRLQAELAAESPDDGTVTYEDRSAPGPAGAVPVRVYRPAAVTGTLPLVLFIHGGGMMLGSVETAHLAARRLTAAVQCVLVSVDYRLAPEHPDPAPVEDCYAALLWAAATVADLGADASRLAVYGPSAGGGLAAGVALLARDRGGPALVLQALIYPMLDDRNDTRSSHEIIDLGVWDRAANLEGWGCLLGDRVGTGGVSPYAAPARATDLRGLPPAYIDVGELDLFRDEDIDYATRLLQAGVPTELHVYAGGVHGGEAYAPEAALSARVLGWRVDALRRALHG